MRATTEPQSEGLVRFLDLELLLHQLVQFRHPAEGEVAVGEEDPVTFSHSFFDHLPCSRSLTLPEGQAVKTVRHPRAVSKLEQGLGWVLYGEDSTYVHSYMQYKGEYAMYRTC